MASGSTLCSNIFPGSQTSAAYNATAVNFFDNPSATCTFTLPTNISYVMFNGTLGPEYTTMQVKVTPSPPSTNAQMAAGTFLNYNNYNVPNTPVYLAALDPALQYTFVVNAKDAAHGQEGGFSGLTLYSTNG